MAHSRNIIVDTDPRSFRTKRGTSRFTQPTYPEEEARTKQSFKDDCDIHKILARAQKVGTLSHLEKHGAFYGDFANVDLLEAHQNLARANEIFQTAPAEIRREFRHDATEFFEFVNDPANKDRLKELLPALAKPGTQLPDVRRSVNSPSIIGEPKDPEDPIQASSDASTEGASTPPKEEKAP